MQAELSAVLTGLVLLVPMAAFALLFALTIVQPALHILAVLFRLVTRQRLGLDWWILGRILPVLLMLAVIAPFAYFTRDWSPETQFALGQFGVMFLAIGAIMVPVALPLFRAYSDKANTFAVYSYGVLAFLAMPIAATLTTGAILEGARFLAAQTEDGDKTFATLPQVFLLVDHLSPCTTAFSDIIPMSIVSDRPGAEPGPVFDYRVYFFWVDMTLKAAFLDFFEVFDCSTSNVRHNTDHLMMSAFVFLYRAFVQLIVLAALAYPFTRRR
ncbi:MAG TPA: hypothetical protein DCL54_09445 [Alphaproteobacteria bacterium]|nr:hypothetical protein [Alphaproteobacteria bacterium]